MFINSEKLFIELIQVGIVVSDLKQSMDRYLNKYGIGPWYVIEFNSSNVSEMELYGVKKNYSMKLGVCTIGNIRFELIESVTNSIYLDYIKKYGESIIHHLKLKVKDYFKAIDYLNSKGIKSIQLGHQLGVKGKNIYNYLNTSETLGFITEIVDISQDFIKPEPEYWYPGSSVLNLNSIFLRPTQVGIVVNDLNKKIQIYKELFNLKPDEVLEFSSNNNIKIYNTSVKYSIKIAFYNLNNITLKVIQSFNNNSIYNKFYRKYGDGVIHHLRMEVSNYDETLKKLVEIGVKVILAGEFLDKVKFSYLDTSNDINFITEIIDNSIDTDISYCP